MNLTIGVAFDLKALPETTVIVQTPTIISVTTRTDDLGFTAFEHPIDNRPIISGDITYRREIFYPSCIGAMFRTTTSA